MALIPNSATCQLFQFKQFREPTRVSVPFAYMEVGHLAVSICLGAQRCSAGVCSSDAHVLKVQRGKQGASLSELPADGKITAHKPQLSPTMGQGSKGCMSVQRWGRSQLSFEGVRGRVIWVLKLKLRKKHLLG